MESQNTLSFFNSQRDPESLIQRLIDANIPVERVDLDMDEFADWFKNNLAMYDHYRNMGDVLIEKCMEHFIAYKFTQPEPGHIYIDIAASDSNWYGCLIEKGITAYSLDLMHSEGIHGNKIGADAAATRLPDNWVDAMSLQCSFETFRGDHDKLFIREAKRILKEGGKVVISPLYIDMRHFILSSKDADLAKTPLDEGAIRVWREDQYKEEFSRHYSPEALAERIFAVMDGLSAKVIYINNLEQYRKKFPGQRIYCDFNLFISKPARSLPAEGIHGVGQFYNDQFYAEQRKASCASAKAIVPIVLEVFDADSVIDVGCGVGGWLQQFLECGVASVHGYDVNDLGAEKYIVDKKYINTKADFARKDFKIHEKSDLLICLEVAEHLPADVADQFVENLVGASQAIIFSAALPGQTGINHINEQPPWYWREKFNRVGYIEIDFIRPQIMTNEEVSWWYRQNITCFVSPNVLSRNSKLSALAKSHMQAKDVHKLTMVNEWVLKRILNGQYSQTGSINMEVNNKPVLSVIIPTRNRHKLLYNTLESLTNQRYPANCFEVLVVDNGSTDATAEACQHFQLRIKQFKYIYEPRPGLHNGRHAGLKQAKAGILVYADDDIEAEATWLEAIAESFDNPEVALVGGKILPKFEGKPPEWVAALSTKTDAGWSLGWYSLLDFGDSIHEIPPEYVWGCNFSIRKNVLLQIGGFHPDAFPQELIKYRGDGETFVSESIRNLGLKAIYNPKAAVKHVVSTNRLTEDYIYRRAYNQGISDSYASIRKNRSFLDPIQYGRTSKTICDTVQIGLADGFNYHQQIVQTDNMLQKWVLKENYL